MVRNTGRFTKTLAIAGTVLTWFPIAVTLAAAIVGTLTSGAQRIDYLMPAELFPAALAGGGLLLWAAWRARRRIRPIGGGLALLIGMLVGSQAAAVVTGLASGETAASGWPLVVVMAGLAGYTVALIWLGVNGVLLARDLFAA